MTIYIATTIRRYVAELAALGRTEALLGDLDILATSAIDRGRDLPVTELVRLMEHLATTGPADIALRCGSGRRLAEMGVAGHAIASSRTLGAALQIATAHGTGNDALRTINYQQRNNELIADIRPTPGLAAGVRRLVCEEWIATFFAYLAEVTQITRPQVRIELDYAPLAEVDYARWLPNRPTFARRKCRLFLPAALLEQRLVSYDYDMLQLILRHFAERPVERDFAEKVRRYLVLNEGGQPKLAGASAYIGISQRTLVRRLAEEGKTFRALLDDHRHGYALALARDGQLGLKQIAAALGYQSEQSLKRAFVHWTGKPLGQWRRENGISGRGWVRRASSERDVQ
jgi:AraC-like DNA-binding protein